MQSSNMITIEISKVGTQRRNMTQVRLSIGKLPFAGILKLVPLKKLVVHHLVIPEKHFRQYLLFVYTSTLFLDVGILQSTTVYLLYEA